MRSSEGSAVRHSGLTVGVVVAVAVGFLCAEARGNGFRNPPAGAAALALDGAKTTLIRDASAVSVNPANLAGLKDGSVMAAATFVDAKADYTSPFGMKLSTDSGVQVLPNLFGVWPLQDGKFVAGLGVTTPYGQGTDWPKASPFLYHSELFVADIGPCVATKLNDQLSIGVGADIYTSQLELRQMLTPVMGAKLSGDGSAFGGNAGVTWRATPRQTVALTYRSGFDVDYEGDTEITGIPKTDFDTRIRFPSVATLGYGVQVADAVRVGADVEWVEFSRYQSMPLGYGNNPVAAAVPLPRELPQDWDDVWTAGVAGDWRCSDAVTLRGSYRYLPTPIPDDTYSPAFQDADKHILAVGLGWRSGRHVVDVSYALGLLKDRDIKGNVNPFFDGKYEYSSQIAGLSYNFTF